MICAEFGWEAEPLSQALRALGNAATVIYPCRLPEVVEGALADNRVLECAVEASAGYLVTGARRHLLPLEKHQGVRIVNAPRFLSAPERKREPSVKQSPRAVKDW